MPTIIDARSTPGQRRRLQRAINLRGRTRGVTVLVDGILGPESLAGERTVAARLGVQPVTGSTTAAARRQRVIFHPGRRTPAEIARGRRAVAAWRRERRAAGGLRERAYEQAARLVGVMELGGNNRGAKVTEIIHANGGTAPEPWCGDFAAYCYRLAGSRAVARAWASVRLLGSVPGVQPTATPRRGDLVRFTFDHVGLFVRDLGDGRIETIEGNTGTAGAVSDSATGGDGVYRKRRATSLVHDYLTVTR